MGKVKILIVEDELLLALALRRTLEKAGYECISPAVDYQSAVDLALEERPDLILMDIMLKSEKTGIDAARTIQSRVPAGIIFVTGNAALLKENSTENIDYYDVLTKPVSPPGVLASVAAYLD
ncbi:MAG: response regulator [Spirochaetia bacterium]